MCISGQSNLQRHAPDDARQRHRAAYAWGPSGHLLNETINGAWGGTFSEHWDGDSVLLEQSLPTGGMTATDVQIGKLAVASNTGVAWSIVVEDRDFSGGVVARHG